MSIIEIPRHVSRPPEDGDAVVICCDRAPRRPIVLVTANPDDAGYWYECTPPVEISDPKAAGNLTARWFAQCGGCSRAAGHRPLAVPIRGHFFFGHDDDAGARAIFGADLRDVRTPVNGGLVRRGVG